MFFSFEFSSFRESSSLLSCLMSSLSDKHSSSTANLKESLRDRKAFSCDSEEEEDREEEPHSLATPDLLEELELSLA